MKANPSSSAGLFFAGRQGAIPAASRIASFALALLAMSAIVFFSLWQLTTRHGWGEVWKYRQMFAQGWVATLGISLASLVISSLIGMLLAWFRRSAFLPLRYFSRIYVEIIRGTPLLVQILLIFYGVFHQVGIEDRTVAGVLILSGFHGAYISEIIRAGIESIGASQLDSARAIGLTRPQSFRYVVFPQTIRRILPPLAGEFVSLVKDSSLLYVIGVNELTQNASNINSYTFSSLESYFPLAAGYLVITLAISLWTQSLEQRNKFET